jgi:hypothetical protein
VIFRYIAVPDAHVHKLLIKVPGNSKES